MTTRIVTPPTFRVNPMDNGMSWGYVETLVMFPNGSSDPTAHLHFMCSGTLELFYTAPSKPVGVVDVPLGIRTGGGIASLPIKAIYLDELDYPIREAHRVLIPLGAWNAMQAYIRELTGKGLEQAA